MTREEGEAVVITREMVEKVRFFFDARREVEGEGEGKERERELTLLEVFAVFRLGLDEVAGF